METCEAMCKIMKELNIAIDGGKDSLSMAAKVKSSSSHEVVKSPGTLVVSAYAPVPDIRQKVTPEIQYTNTSLVYVNVSGSSQYRIGGSAFTQVYKQLGNDCPDIENASLLKSCFNIVQQLIKNKICLAGHDVSDGGLIVCLLEMAFVSNLGLDVNIQSSGNNPLNVLFAEECGVVIEVVKEHLGSVLDQFKSHGISAQAVGNAIQQDLIRISVDGQLLVNVRNFIKVSTKN